MKLPRGRSLVIVGQGRLREADGASVLATRCESRRLGLGPAVLAHGRRPRRRARLMWARGRRADCRRGRGADVIYNLAQTKIDIAPGAFVIYRAATADRGAHRARRDPCPPAITEEQGLFVNTEGRPHWRCALVRRGEGQGETGRSCGAVAGNWARRSLGHPGPSCAALGEGGAHLGDDRRGAGKRAAAARAWHAGTASFAYAVADLTLPSRSRGPRR